MGSNTSAPHKQQQDDGVPKVCYGRVSFHTESTCTLSSAKLLVSTWGLLHALSIGGGRKRDHLQGTAPVGGL